MGKYKNKYSFDFVDAWDGKTEVEAMTSGKDFLFQSHFAMSRKDARRLAYFILHKTKRKPPSEGENGR